MSEILKIVAVADLHGHLPQLEEADVVCIVGDITPDCYRMDADRQWKWVSTEFIDWATRLDCKAVLVVPGNHDYCFEKYGRVNLEENVAFLNNEEITVNGFTFYGTPNVPKPTNNLAFCQEPDELSRTFRAIPDKLDFLLCHASPYGVNGCGVRNAFGKADVGSRELTEAIKDKEIGWVLCGHVHTGNHEVGFWRGKCIANVSYCNEKKEPAYSPLMIERYPNGRYSWYI